MKTTSALLPIPKRAALLVMLAVSLAGASATVVGRIGNPDDTTTFKHKPVPEKIRSSRPEAHARQQTPPRAGPPVHNKLVDAPEPPAGKVAADLFWVADSRKMDEFLAQVQMPEGYGLDYFGETLPDTRTAWRDYPKEARIHSSQGRVAEAAGRLAQMLKLAAVYRAYGGMENVVQSEEIRHLAGLTTEALGSAVTTRIQSPYLESSAEECLAQLKARIGRDLRETKASFRQNLAKRALETHARLAQARSAALTTTSTP